jgi:hypothetical protein
MYRILCECVKVYVGQTGRSIEPNCKEHMKHVRLKQPDKSVVVEHNFNAGRCIVFSSTSVLDRTTGYMDCLVKEAVEIRLNTGNFNRNSGFMLSRPWYCVMNMLYNQKAGQNGEHLTPPTSPHWLVRGYEHGARAGIYMTRMGTPATSVP